MAKPFDIPESWGLSTNQEALIGYLLDYPGEYLSPAELCDGLYGEVLPDNAPAPAKLRVLVQRCRDIVWELSKGKVDIEVRRGKGWRITKKGRLLMQKAVDK